MSNWSSGEEDLTLISVTWGLSPCSFWDYIAGSISSLLSSVSTFSTSSTRWMKLAVLVGLAIDLRYKLCVGLSNVALPFELIYERLLSRPTFWRVVSLSNIILFIVITSFRKYIDSRATFTLPSEPTLFGVKICTAYSFDCTGKMSLFSGTVICFTCTRCECPIPAVPGFRLHSLI